MMMWLKVCFLSFVAVLGAAQFEPAVDVFGGESVKPQPNEEFPFGYGEPERPLDNSSPIAEKEVLDPPTFDHPPEDEQPLPKPHPLRSLGKFSTQYFATGAHKPTQEQLNMLATHADLRTPYHNRYGWSGLSCKMICHYAGDKCNEEATAWVQQSASNCNAALFSRKQTWHIATRIKWPQDNLDFSGCYWTGGNRQNTWAYWGTKKPYWDPSDEKTACNIRSKHDSQYRQNRVCMCTNKWLWNSTAKPMLRDFMTQGMYFVPTKYGSCSYQCSIWGLKCNEKGTQQISASKENCRTALRASFPDYVQYGKRDLIEYHKSSMPYGCNVYQSESNFEMYWGNFWKNPGCTGNYGNGILYLVWRKMCACQQYD